MSTLKNSLAEAEIDTAILVNGGTNWRKVAMVIAVVSRDCADAPPEEVADFEYIASRIEALIA
jgi:hypothetical protein